jgi:FAD/FMN-containing dehydrogenase
MPRQFDRSQLTTLRADLERVGCLIVEHISDGDLATRRWNGALQPRPALIARCYTTSQVASALAAASAASVPVSIHNGGQDWQGRSLRDDTLVLDISAMTSIEIDTANREAVIGGGVTAGQLNDAAGAKSLAAVIGNDGAVGMAGLFLGGGYGPLMTRFGLACDNLISAEVALPNGTVVNCDATNNKDLFWAIRGGGGNFGVVTSARIRLHKVDTVVANSIIFAWIEARAALARYADLMLCAPAELFGSAVLAEGPDGNPVVVISLVWTGELDQGHAFVAEVAAAGTPVLIRGGVMPASALLSLTDGKLVQGRGYDVGTRWFRTLPPATVESLVSEFEHRSSSLSSVVVHHCHGSATDVPSDATAFGMREPHFTALLYAAWEPASDDATRHSDWMRQTDNALKATALPGGYANLLADMAIDQIAYAYGSNTARLTQFKARYDPKGILEATPLPIVI